MYRTNHVPMREKVLNRGFIVTGTGVFPGEMDQVDAETLDEAEQIAKDAAQRGRVSGIYALVKIHEPVTTSTAVLHITDIVDEGDDLPF